MNLFTRLSISSNDPTLPIINPADVRPLHPYEAGAFGHWVFDSGGAASLKSKIGEETLSIQSGQPTYASNFITPLGRGNALMSGFEDRADAEDTICVVARLNAVGAIAILAGSLENSLSPVRGGSPFVNASSALSVSYRGVTGSQPLGDTASADEWFFVAVSRRFNGLSKQVRALSGIGDTIYNYATSSAYLPHGTMNLGQSYYATGMGPTDALVDYAEFIIIPRFMGEAELRALHARSRARMAAIGITIA